MIQRIFPGFDLYYADPAQPFITAREEQDGLYHDLPKVWSIVHGPQAVLAMLLTSYLAFT